MSATSVVVGIDVAKAYVDVAVLGGKFDAPRFANEAEGHSALAAALQPLGVVLVVMERLRLPSVTNNACSSSLGRCAPHLRSA